MNRKKTGIGVVFLIMMITALFISCGENRTPVVSSSPLFSQSPFSNQSEISDVNQPTKPSVKITGNPTTVTSPDLILELSADDDVGVVAYYISEYPKKPQSYYAFGWKEVLNPSKNFQGFMIPLTLSNNNGLKRIYVWFKDAAGNISDAAETFVTLKESNIKVVKKFPINGDILLEGDIAINATFSTDMDPSSLNDSNVTMLKWTGNSPFDLSNEEVKGNISYDNDKKELTFEPNNRLTPGTYLVTLSDDILTARGSNLDATELWGFAVSDLVIEPKSATYETPKLDITIHTTSPNVTIKYTTDGTDPESSATAKNYSGKFTIDKSQKISATATSPASSLKSKANSEYQLRWWTPVAGGIDGEVYDMLLNPYSGDLYIAGAFKKIYQNDGSDATANNIAIWNVDRGKWKTLSNGLAGQYVKTLSYGPDGKIYAGGSFTTTVSNTSGNVTVRNVAKWNGNEWEAMENGTTNEVVSLASDGSNLYIATNSDKLITWNGTKFITPTLRPFPTGWIVNSITQITTDSRDNIHMIGSEVSAAKWDNYNNKWVPLPSLEGDGVALDLDIDRNPTVIVYNSKAGITTQNLVQRWDASSQNWMKLGYRYLNNKLHAVKYYGGELYVGGEFTTASDSIVKWSETDKDWREITPVQALPLSAIKAAKGIVRAIDFDNKGNLYVGGKFPNVGGTKNEYYILKWGIIE
ncbi:MAG: Ig-like domain-containing protein [Pseudomonadota bacterium]